ncbi:MAG: hypothetical protein R2799_07150 [Crocinitomicaceae bacterium]
MKVELMNWSSKSIAFKKTVYLILLTISVIILFLLLSISMELPKYIKTIIVFFFFGLIAFVTFNYLELSSVKEKVREWIMLFVVLGSGVGIGLTDQYFKEEALLKNGEYTYGIVISKKVDLENTERILCEFKYQGKDYQTYWIALADDEDYVVGDTIAIYFDSSNPEVSMVIEVENFIFN